MVRVEIDGGLLLSDGWTGTVARVLIVLSAVAAVIGLLGVVTAWVLALPGVAASALDPEGRTAIAILGGVASGIAMGLSSLVVAGILLRR